MSQTNETSNTDELNKVVLDPSIFLNALLHPESIESQIIRTWENNQLHVLISAKLFNEIEQVLVQPNPNFKEPITDKDVTYLLNLLEKKGVQTPDQLHLSVFQDDETANTVLSCAVEGKANYIISTNPNLLNLKHYKGILILSPTSLHIIK